jgi:hypothetical protein
MLHFFAVYGKATDPNDKAPYKGYMVAARDEEHARSLVPGLVRIEYVERGAPLNGFSLPAILHTIEFSVRPYKK